ncbi:MAG: hypothetical protein NZO58_08960, partial [Gemmataceae bacterium]|nr:hypothetical protein [Gemmataceae bacterium]
MDIRKVKKLIELLEESGIAEIEIKEGEESVRISRHPTGSVATPIYPLPATVHGPEAAGGGAAAASATGAASSAAGGAAPRADEHVVTAPMVGTFYSSP